MVKKLTKKQKEFADKFIETGNGAEAAREAYNIGGKGGDDVQNVSSTIASENFKKKNIIDYVKKYKKPTKEKKMQDWGICYIIQCVETERVKIGWTNDEKTWHRRQIDFKMMSPTRLDTLILLKGGRQTEMILHMSFAEDRLHGEWFEFSDDIKKFIKETQCLEG